MQTTEELIMRDGCFVRRTVTTQETNIGDQVELLHKLLPRPSSTLYRAFTCTWRTLQCDVHLINSGNKLAALVEVPVIGPRCLYRPAFNLEGRSKAMALSSMSAQDKAEFAKKMDDYVESWVPDFGKSTPTSPFEVVTQASIPWNNTVNGTLLFICTFDRVSNTNGVTPMTGLQVYQFNSCYMAALVKKDLRALNLVNHFDDGRVCMGQAFDNQYAMSRQPTQYLVQRACDSYNATQSNSHLFKSGMHDVWTLNKDRSDLLNPSSANVLKRDTLSLSFMTGLL